MSTTNRCQHARCSEISESLRLNIFNYFSKLTVQGQRNYVRKVVTTTKKQQPCKLSHRYYLKMKSSDIKFKVCQTMFLSTLGITEKIMRNWIHTGKKKPNPKVVNDLFMEIIEDTTTMMTTTTTTMTNKLLLCMDIQTKTIPMNVKDDNNNDDLKLNVYNFTINNNITKESDNYIWDETEGNFEPSTFITCLMKYLESHINDDIEHVIIYSGGGSYFQKRNVHLSNALLTFAIKFNLIIEQKFLVPGYVGHQLECQKVHSMIQKKITYKKINLPSQFVQYVERARKYPSPLRTHHLDHTFFNDYTIKGSYINIRPGKNRLLINDIRALSYHPSGLIYYKANIKDCYSLLPNKAKRTSTTSQQLQPLYTQRLKINKEKYYYLNQLKYKLPNNCHPFYINLPYE